MYQLYRLPVIISHEKYNFSLLTHFCHYTWKMLYVHVQCIGVVSNFLISLSVSESVHVPRVFKSLWTVAHESVSESTLKWSWYAMETVHRYGKLFIIPNRAHLKYCEVHSLYSHRCNKILTGSFHPFIGWHSVVDLRPCLAYPDHVPATLWSIVDRISMLFLIRFDHWL